MPCLMLGRKVTPIVVEVITGERRPRRWTGEEKARIVAESFEEGTNISEVARRNGISRGLLTVWRRQITAMAGKAPSFVPVQIQCPERPALSVGASAALEGDRAAD